MSELNVSSTPQGKGLAITGFVLALVGLLLSSIIAGIAVASIIAGGSPWIMYLWIVVCLVSIVLSVMGMSKLGKTGGKKGLGIAGMIIGIVATVYAIILSLGVGAAAAMSTGFSNEMNKIDMSNFSQELNEAMDEAENNN